MSDTTLFEAPAAELDVERFERIVAGESLALLRLGARWRAAPSTPVLVAEDVGRTERFAPLRQPPETIDWLAGDARLWWAGYAVPVGIVLSRHTRWALEDADGGRIALPVPELRSLLDLVESGEPIAPAARSHLAMVFGMLAAAVVPLGLPAVAAADGEITASGTGGVAADPAAPTGTSGTGDATTTDPAAATTPAAGTAPPPADPTAPPPAAPPVAPAAPPAPDRVSRTGGAGYGQDAPRRRAPKLPPAHVTPHNGGTRPLPVRTTPPGPTRPATGQAITPTAPPTPAPATPRTADHTLAPAPAHRQAVPGSLLQGFAIPPFLLPIYQAAGTAYDVPWEVLASINEVETDYGRNLNVSTAGARGWMQFMPSTWLTYGVDANLDGRADPNNPADAIFAAASYLHAAGASTDLRGAIFSYNHADWYVEEVLAKARQLRRLPSDLTGALTGLAQGRMPVDGRVSYSHPDSAATSAAGPPRPAPAGRATRHEATLYAEPGRPAVAVADGTVVAMGESRLGAWIVLRDAYGNRFTYGHLGGLPRRYAVPKPRVVTAEQTMRELHLDGSAPIAPGAVAESAPLVANPVDGVRRSRPAGWARRVDTSDDVADAPSAQTASASQTVVPAVPAPVTQGVAGLRVSRVAGWPRRVAEAVPSTPAGSAFPARLRRLLAHPVRGLGLIGGARTPAADGALDPQTRRSALDAAARALGLRPSQVVLRDLRPGARVVAGTVLGRLAGHSSSHRRATMLFRVHPAGAGAPAIDPTPLLDGWRLLQSTRVYGPAGSSTLDQGKGPLGTGQTLLLSKDALARRVLADPRIQIYACGQDDIRSGQIDRRVLATLEYLADSGLDPTVSALKCGHSLLTTSGNISEHSTGDAVDIAAINGVPIVGHQGPGTITDTTIRRLLTLQGTMKPHQIISLMTFPGATNTLAMADHYDHIHVGFRPDGGTSPALGEQMSTILAPAQWDVLMARLATLGNPQVSSRPSQFALKVAGPPTRYGRRAGTSGPPRPPVA